MSKIILKKLSSNLMEKSPTLSMENWNYQQISYVSNLNPSYVKSPQKMFFSLTKILDTITNLISIEIASFYIVRY
jgi:hypothetical protein